FLFLAFLSAVVMAGIFPVSSPTSFGHLLQFLYDHVPGAAGLRTTYKFGGTLALSLAVLVGVGLEEAWPRARAAARPAWRLVVAGLAVAVIAANAVPLWTGGLYAKERSVRDVPEYWREAIRYLDGRDGGYRVFFAPRSVGAAYRWGDLHDGIAEAFLGLS